MQKQRIMKYILIISLVFLYSCSDSSEKSVSSSYDEERKNELNQPLKALEPTVDPSVELPATINSIHNAKFKVVEITDSTYVKVILLDVVNREDFEEVEDAVLKTREKFKLYKGVESTGKLFFKFYATQKHFDTDALPTIASTFYNNLNGKTGMDIYWGRSTEITKIITTPDRKVIQQ